MSQVSDNKRIAKNTVFLYFRMFIIMGVTLYTSRVVLDKLGADDYGLYNVVGGVVAMLGFLNGTLSISTSRFITFELGTGSLERQKRTFSTALIIHLALCGFVFIFLETVGLLFFYNKLVIPPNRLEATFWVYQCSIITSIIAISQVPYTSAIMGHERMNIYAYISIFEAIAKLLIVYFLTITSYDKMVFYAILIGVVQFFVAMSYRMFCIWNFKECHLSLDFDKGIFKRMISFSGWNLTANVAEMLKLQGVLVLMSMFFQPAVVAAQAIGNQITGAMMQFINNVKTAVNPQIIKLYASGDYAASRRLTLKSTVYVFDLLLLLGLPFILLMEPVLKLWLVEVPPYTVVFAQYIVASQIIGNFAASFYTPMVASGKIKKNAVAAVIFGFGHFVILYLILKYGGGEMWVQYTNLALIAIFSYVVKPYILYKDINYSVRELLVCYGDCLKVTALSCILSVPVYLLLDKTLINYVFILCVTVVSVAISSYVFTEKSDRQLLGEVIKKRILRYKLKK